MPDNAMYDKIVGSHLDALKRTGNYRYFLNVQKSAQSFPEFTFADADGHQKTAVNWCSNDYLCMSLDADVLQSLVRVAEESGAGAGGTRNISGTTVHHNRLESCLANLHGTESALVFGSAFMANLGALGALGKAFPGCVILSDERNHASMIEGVKIARCDKQIFRHNDAEHLESLLRDLPMERPKIIAFESLYSMAGTVAPIQEFVRLAKRYNALTYVDEVHAVGVYGRGGAGLIEQHGCAGQVDMINGTFAKGFGTLGGYIASRALLIDYVRSFAPSFIFTTSLPPALCAATLTSVEKVRSRSGLQKAYQEHVRSFRRILREHSVPFDDNPSHITRILIGDAMRCKAIADTLLHEYGAYLQPINFPTVPEGEECLRLTVTLRHSVTQMRHLAAALAETLASMETE
jgi:5-aminolevulinate synthase